MNTPTNIRRETGSAFVELALTLPVFVLLLIGAAEFARFAYVGIEVSNAARAGVAYAAQSRVTASDNDPIIRTAIINAALRDGSDVTELTAAPNHFCRCSDGSSSTCLPTDCSGSRIIEYVQVNTSATVNSLFNYPGLPGSLTLHGQAIMRVGQ
jgi:hypothetical protein